MSKPFVFPSQGMYVE